MGNANDFPLDQLLDKMIASFNYPSEHALPSECDDAYEMKMLVADYAGGLDPLEDEEAVPSIRFSSLEQIPEHALTWGQGANGKPVLLSAAGMDDGAHDHPFFRVSEEHYPMMAALTCFTKEESAYPDEEPDLKVYSQRLWDQLENCVATSPRALQFLTLLKTSASFKKAQEAMRRERFKLYSTEWGKLNIEALSNGEYEAVEAYLQMSLDEKIEAYVFVEGHQNVLGAGEAITEQPLLLEDEVITLARKHGKWLFNNQIVRAANYAEARSILAECVQDFKKMMADSSGIFVPLRSDVATNKVFGMTSHERSLELRKLMEDYPFDENLLDAGVPERAAWIAHTVNKGGGSEEIADALGSLPSSAKLFLTVSSENMSIYNDAVILADERAKNIA